MSPALEEREVAPVFRDEVLRPLELSFEWLLSLRDGQGRIVCPEHRVEHTGKSACAAITAVELHRATGEERFAAAALEQGRRLVSRLEREGTSPCHTFRPGRHDPFNCSNSVIDGGACSDALAHLVQHLGAALTPADREAFEAASVLHARTYLKYAVLDKGIPAQRAWGLTGLAGAYALSRDEDLLRAGLEAVGVLEAIQYADGSYPYHPEEWGAEHPGASDVSSFYQSRVTAFLMHSLDGLGRDPRDGLFEGPLRRGLEFLLALQGVDGIKTGLLEAKPWYWGAPYEVASNVFDAYALARGWRLFGEERMGRGALAAVSAWARHLAPDGKPTSHLPGHGRGRSYQCPCFWAAHACWIARALPELEAAVREFGAHVVPEAGAEPGRALDLRVSYFPNADLVRLEDAVVVAWVRGGRAAVNVQHGSPYGAGLLRAQRVADGAELIGRCRLGGANEGEWSGKWGRASLRRGWASGGSAVRFSGWLARVHWRAGRYGEALLEPLRTFRRGVLAFGHPRVGSAFHLSPEVQVIPGGVVLKSALARRDGTPVPGSSLERVFRIDGWGLLVEDRLQTSGPAREVRYRPPSRAVEVVEQPGEVRFRLA